VIQSLEAGDHIEALRWWKVLQDQNPETYRSDFDYCGEQCLFSLALHRHLQLREGAQALKNDALPKRKDLVLIEILSGSRSPLSKEVVFNFLWGAAPEDKTALNRLERIVSRVRFVHGLNVISKKKMLFNQITSFFL